MTDAFSIVWKEWREVMGQRGLRGKSGILLNIAVFGGILPLQFGPEWITRPGSAIIWSWVPMYLVMTVITDAFAGERERHTLETLLATRLSDQSILFGKIMAAIAYAGTITFVALVLGVVTVNLMDNNDGVILYDPDAVLLMLVFGLLGAILVAAAGVLISLRSPTVRQAQQTLGGAIVLAMIIPFVAARLLPAEWKSVLVAPVNASLLGMGLLGLLAAIDVMLLYILIRRFNRSRILTIIS
jgi:ABC-2 type transport system permease protein